MLENNTQPVVSEGIDRTQDIENRSIPNPTNIKDIVGFFEVLTSVPTFVPKTFYDSIKIYNGAIYIFNFKTNTWVSTSGAGYLISTGKGTTLPSASANTDGFYYKTDTDTLYRSNGTAWIALN